MDGLGHYLSEHSLNNGVYFGAWKEIGAVDLNNEGAVDLIWQNATTNQVLFWFLDGLGHYLSQQYRNNGVNFGGWKVIGAVDVNSDGAADLIWQNATTNQVLFWFLDGHGRYLSQRSLSNGVNFGSWKVIGAADVNSDGAVDLIWQKATTNRVLFRFLDGHGHYLSQQYLSNGVSFGSWKVIGAADVNSDGAVDLIWQNATTNQVLFWFLDGHGHYLSQQYLNNGMNFGAWKVKP